MIATTMLSYAWESQIPDRSIIIRYEDGGGKLLPIIRNVELSMSIWVSYYHYSGAGAGTGALINQPIPVASVPTAAFLS
jgi:hypothetical protein